MWCEDRKHPYCIRLWRKILVSKSTWNQQVEKKLTKNVAKAPILWRGLCASKNQLLYWAARTQKLQPLTSWYMIMYMPPQNVTLIVIVNTVPHLNHIKVKINNKISQNICAFENSVEQICKQKGHEMSCWCVCDQVTLKKNISKKTCQMFSWAGNIVA